MDAVRSSGSAGHRDPRAAVAEGVVPGALAVAVVDGAAATGRVAGSPQPATTERDTGKDASRSRARAKAVHGAIIRHGVFAEIESRFLQVAGIGCPFTPAG